MRSVAAVSDEVNRGCHIFEKGPAWIVHALLDHLIDHYLPLMDAFDEAIDEIEVEVVTRPNQAALKRIFSLKRSLMALRRVAMHQREILMRLSRGEFALVPSPLLPLCWGCRPIACSSTRRASSSTVSPAEAIHCPVARAQAGTDSVRAHPCSFRPRVSRAIRTAPVTRSPRISRPPRPG